ncbi:sulfite exporter TauE/SafE family protein [Clostridioides sp. ES-S-0054-01]|uniref:sulfite exporter TauE/SafE family protein n=2 Tax=Clostridioides TaxID=1870884 RepID=UPI0037BF561D
MFLLTKDNLLSNLLLCFNILYHILICCFNMFFLCKIKQTLKIIFNLILYKYNLPILVKLFQKVIFMKKTDDLKKKYFNFNLKNTIIGVFTGFINGVFGSGGGTLLVPILNDIVKIEEHKSHATALSIIVFLTTASSVLYVSKGTYDVNLTIKVAVGSILGGIIGAKLLNKVTGKFLRISFGIIMIIAALRMVF